MKIKIQVQSTGYPLTVSKKLVAILQRELDRLVVDQTTAEEQSEGVTFNFRDPDYSAESGGYHPVEISVDGEGRISYITDFAYVGIGAFAELDREIDFDFGFRVFQHMGREFPIERGASLFRIWQANFCSYVERQVFQISITSHSS